MKILMVNKFLYHRGGCETYMFSLADYLKQLGHEIQFFGMYDKQNIVTMPKKQLINEINFHKTTLATITYPFKIIYSFEAKEKIKMMIKEYKPDIVHLNNYNFQITPSIIHELKKYGMPIIQTIHDVVMICPSHLLYNCRTQEICEKCKGRKYINCIKTRCIHGSTLRSILGAFEGYLYYKLKTYDFIDEFICPSQFIADKLIEFGMNPYHIHVLHNFIREIHKVNDVQKKEYFLYFGRIAEEKGIRMLLETAKLLPDIKFIIAGTGPLENILKIRPNNVEYVGFKEGEELARLIQESLATIHPSTWYENCPMSVLESLGLGTPVIGAKIGGIPELVRDGIDGLLFKPGDIEDLASKIDFFDKECSVLNRYSRNCEESIKKYSIENYSATILKIYKDVINKVENNRRKIAN
jgi:glycosyltransferase involved in cell wall biosynthesis